MRGVLNRRRLWGLVGIVFFAAYRGIFETVLFFQAVWTQSTASGTAHATITGFMPGVAVVVAAAWAVSSGWA